MEAALQTAAPVAPSPVLARLWRSRAAWRLAVFLGVLAVQGGSAWQHYSPDRWLYRDGSFYFNTVRGLVENGSLDQSHLHPRSWFNGRLRWNYNLTDDWSNVSVGRDGTTWYPKHPLLMPILSVPFYLALGDVGTLVFNVLCGVLAALLAAELACAFTARWAASLIGFGLGVVPLIVREAYGFNNDLFYTVLVVGTAVCVANRQMGRAGLLAGFSVFAKITNVFFLAAFGAWVLATRDRRLILRFVAACSIGLAVTLIVNWVLFGAPWITAYQRVLIVHNGAQEIQSHTRLFHREFWEGLHALWGWPEYRDPQGRGVMAVFPAYLPALLGTGVLAWRKRWVEALVFLFALTWPLFFFAKYDWYRDDFCDPVYFLCAAPLAAWAGLLFAPAKEPESSPRSWRAGLGAVAAALALCIVGRGALALAHRGPYTLVGDVKHAEVFLGDIPCDYFNNQVHRWECSYFDRGSEWLMTGETLDGEPVFDGQKRTMIAINPHPQGVPRRMLFHVPMGRSFTLWHGIPDGVPGGIPVDL
ncbi:MAG TPA: hypothetical protein VMB50_02820, partial [Myxococcales bacterium]|nr:hypothetical protein [Myxococcales bacterium]